MSSGISIISAQFRHISHIHFSTFSAHFLQSFSAHAYQNCSAFENALKFFNPGWILTPKKMYKVGGGGNRGNFLPIPLKTLTSYWGVMGGNSVNWQIISKKELKAPGKVITTSIVPETVTIPAKKSRYRLWFWSNTHCMLADETMIGFL